MAETKSTAIHQNNANLIEESCKQTPHYDLCVGYLSSDPRSTNADVRVLAIILVDIIKTKANDALDKIHPLLQENPQPGQKEALSSFADKYEAIVDADVAQASAALRRGDPKFAEEGANDAAIEATSCQNGFSAGKSPLTNDNNAMHDLAETTAAIVRLLL